MSTAMSNSMNSEHWKDLQSTGKCLTNVDFLVSTPSWLSSALTEWISISLFDYLKSNNIDYLNLVSEELDKEFVESRLFPRLQTYDFSQHWGNDFIDQIMKYYNDPEWDIQRLIVEEWWSFIQICSTLLYRFSDKCSSFDWSESLSESDENNLLVSDLSILLFVHSKEDFEFINTV